MEIFYICFLLFLLGMILWGVVNTLQQSATATPKATGIQTTGTVVRNQICWGRITVVRPVIRFQLRSGRTVELLSRNGVALALSQYAVGQTVQVIYAPTDPADFTIV